MGVAWVELLGLEMGVAWVNLLWPRNGCGMGGIALAWKWVWHGRNCFGLEMGVAWAEFALAWKWVWFLVY